MNLLQKIKSVFAAPKQTNKIEEALQKLVAQKVIASKQNYTSRVFHADKHIKDWKNAIDEATAMPYYRKKNLYELIAQMRFDAQIQAQMQTRKNGTLAEKFLTKTDANTLKLIKQVINVILDSNFYWASACEINGNEVFVISPEYLCPEKQELAIDYETGIPLERFENVLYFQNPNQEMGLLAYASQYAIYKRFSLSDWSRHSELFGMPFLSLRTPITDPLEIKKRHKALSEFGSNAYVILDTDEILEAIDTKTTASPCEIYLQMIRFCDEQISKIIVGQVATADQKAFVGSAEVQERILDWYVEADLLLVSETMNEKVFPFLKQKGLLEKEAVFEWEYFAKKQEKSTEKAKDKEDLVFCKHESDYEDYLFSLKKKPFLK